MTRSEATTQVGWTLATAITPIVWGTTYIVTTELLPPGHPLFASLLRALPAGILAVLVGPGRKLLFGDLWWKAAVLGILNIGAFFPLLFFTAERLPGGVASTLGAIQPIIVAFLAVLILGERLSVWRVGWGAVGVAGVALVVFDPAATLDFWGVVSGLSSPVLVALGLVLTKRWGRPTGMGAMVLAGWQLIFGGLVLLVPALVLEGAPERIDAAAVGGYLWLGLIGGFVAYTLWFAGIRRLPVTATALLTLLAPLTAAVLGALVLGQLLTPLQFMGFALALLALVAGQLPGRRALRWGRRSTA